MQKPYIGLHFFSFGSAILATYHFFNRHVSIACTAWWQEKRPRSPCHLMLLRPWETYQKNGKQTHWESLLLTHSFYLKWQIRPQVAQRLINEMFIDFQWYGRLIFFLCVCVRTDRSKPLETHNTLWKHMAAAWQTSNMIVQVIQH